jgi:hypothetical protein
VASAAVIGPQKRDLNSPWGDHLKQQILSQIPRGKDIGVVAVMGDADSYELGTQIHDFLKSNGFKLKEQSGISQGVFTGVPRGVGFNTDTNEFVIGPQ